MPAGPRLTARYSIPHNMSMAGVSAAMIAVAISHFAANPQNAPTLSLNDPRFTLFVMLAMAMAYYVFLGVSRARNRTPQVEVGSEGIRLGFGRDRLLRDPYDKVIGGVCSGIAHYFDIDPVLIRLVMVVLETKHSLVKLVLCLIMTI